MGRKKHVVNAVFTLLLLGVFALSVVSVAALGVQVYRSSAAKMQANFDTRTSLIYIAEKVRQNGGAGFGVREVAGQPALVIEEEYGSGTYETWIYVTDGTLFETTVKSGAEVSPGGGQAIMDLKSVDFKVDGKLVRITSVNSAGDEESLTLRGRSGT
jgi:hypothetical protein